MRFAERTDWPSEVPALTALSHAMAERGEAVLDLTISNPTRCGFSFYTPDLARSLSSEATLSYAAEAFGTRPAREAVALYYRQRGIEVAAERIILTASSSEAYAYIYRLLANPGDRVAVPSPSYPLFGFLADCNDVSLIYYHLNPTDDWRIDLKSMEEALENGARIITIVSPNNPTGSILQQTEREAVIQLAERYGAAILADEVFADYPLDHKGELCSLAGEDRVLSFALGGLSKSMCLPQMKLGWMVVGGPEEVRAEAMSRLEVLADTYLSVGAAVQAAVPDWFQLQPKIQQEVNERLQRNLSFLRARLSPETCRSSCERVEGGWSAVIRVPSVRTDEEWSCKILEELGVLVHPGSFYGFPGGAWLVVSLLTPEKSFADGVIRLLEMIEKCAE